MTKITSLNLDGFIFKTGDGYAQLVQRHYGEDDGLAPVVDLDEEALGDISEFLAVAWGNLTGETYEDEFSRHLATVGAPLVEADCE